MIKKPKNITIYSLRLEILASILKFVNEINNFKVYKSIDFSTNFVELFELDSVAIMQIMLDIEDKVVISNSSSFFSVSSNDILNFRSIDDLFYVILGNITKIEQEERNSKVSLKKTVYL
jgi:acyl carrier protein